MSKSLWSEGRVVGLSAYELYARYVLANNDTPSDEKSWLASTLSYGSSMLLWVEPDNSVGPHYRDFEFPTTSNLGACNTIVAAFFSGSGVVDSSSPWAVKVESYGPLIENDSTASPNGTVTDISSGVPVKNNGALDQLTIDQIQDFAKITDAVVVQPGTWSANSSGSGPVKKLNPDLTKAPTLRVAFANRVTNGFWLLLTGFIDRNISLGMTKQGDATAPTAPQNGDFLGPAIFPWATKVVISIPPAMMAYMRSVRISTQDIAAIQIYNTRYIWPYCMHEGSGAPTQTDLTDAKQLYQLRGVTGYVSDTFITDYCVDMATAEAACVEGHISDGQHMQRSYIDQIKAMYPNSSDWDNFVFFFWAAQNAIDSPGQQGLFYPVDLRTKSFAFTLTEDTLLMQCTHGFDFSGATSLTDIMGSLYNVTSDYSATSGNMKDSSNVDVFESAHPILHNVVKEFSTFTRAMVAVPKAADGFNNQFVDWFASFKVSDLLDATTLSTMGIDASYHSLDFQSFLQYAAAQRDLTVPLSTEISQPPITPKFYMYDAATITTIAGSSYTWTGYETAVAKVTATIPVIDYYKPANFTIQAITVDTSGATPQETPGAIITAECTSTAYHRWASVTENDDTSIKALSLVDAFGSYLSTAGSAGIINADVLRWSDILDSLNLNRCIDLLGGLINMKNSGTNYIQLGTLRLYVSSTEPTGTIPEGSIGIGWGGVKVYTSGAWVAST